MSFSARARRLPGRLAAGAFILNAGLGKWSADEETAARLHGVADQSMADVGHSLEPLERRLAEADRLRLRAAMGDEAFEAEYNAGRSLDLADVEPAARAVAGGGNDVGEADLVLASYGFGRAHHRVLHFVDRLPGLTIAELLDILRITKQSLSRVLGQLVRQGFIIQRPGVRDRRQRLLDLTSKGRELERRLSEPQRVRVANAYRQVGARAVEGFRKVLLGIIADEHDRRRFERTSPAKR